MIYSENKSEQRKNDLMDWLNGPPPYWAEHGDTVTMHSAPETDFWRITHNDKVIDNGHFYYERRSGNFQADVKINGKYTDTYDQAGLMLRVDETHWIKCGVEFFEEIQHSERCGDTGVFGLVDSSTSAGR